MNEGVTFVGMVTYTIHVWGTYLSWRFPDAPDSPSQPRIEDVDEDSVTLSWTKPRGDGGDRITGYIVEAKMKDSTKWRPLNAKFPCKDLRFVGEWGSHTIKNYDMEMKSGKVSTN